MKILKKTTTLAYMVGKKKEIFEVNLSDVIIEYLSHDRGVSKSKIKSLIEQGGISYFEMIKS